MPNPDKSFHLVRNGKRSYIYILGFNLNVVHSLTRDVKRALERVNKNALEAAI